MEMARPILAPRGVWGGEEKMQFAQVRSHPHASGDKSEPSRSGPENLVGRHGEMAEQTQLQVQDPLSCRPQMPQAKAMSLRARCPLPL